MSFRFSPLPLLFFHKDRSFNLFEKAKGSINVTQKMRRVARGLGFYASLYQQRALACAQVDLHYNLLAFRRSDTVWPLGLPVLGLSNFEDAFLQPHGRVLEAKTAEKDFLRFDEMQGHADYQACFSPWVSAFEGAPVKRKEASPNFFLLDAIVMRFPRIRLSYLDDQGEDRTELLEGELAMDVQVALDYLQGVTPLHFSRNLGRVKATPFCASHLPEFAQLLRQTMQEVAEAVADGAAQDMIRTEGGYPGFLDKEFEKDFDQLVESCVNEYEAKFDKESLNS